MDWRLIVVLLPVIAAGTWAFVQIGKIAIAQAQAFLNRQA